MFTSRRITTMGGDKFRDEFSLAFDGSDDYIDLGSQAGDLRLSGSNGAVVAWIKPTLTGDVYQRIVDKSSGANANQGYAFFLDDDGHLRGAIAGTTTAIGTAGDVVANKWQQVLWTWDGTNHYLYVNGVNVRTQADSTIPPSNTTNMRIGSWNHSTAREYNGKISEVAIYNTFLTASQVKTLYNGREPYNHKEGIASSNLKAWWRMGDGRFDGFASEGIWGGSSGLITDELNPTKSSDLFDSGVGDYSSSIGAWSADGSNTVEIDSGAVKITYVDDSDGARLSLNDAADLTTDLTVGKVYEITFATKVNTGSVSVQLNPGLGTGGAGFKTFTITQTDWVYKKHHFNCEHATNCQLKLSGFGSGEELWIKNVRLRELGTNTGILINMAEGDIVGDAP